MSGKEIRNGKPDLSLIPFDALVEVARAFEDGNAKGYVPNDWRGDKPLSAHHKALLRHALAVNDGEIYDPDSVIGQITHWAKVACNALILIHNLKNHPQLNDLYKGKNDSQ